MPLLKSRRLVLDAQGQAVDTFGGRVIMLDESLSSVSVDVTWLDAGGNEIGTVNGLRLGRRLDAGGDFAGYRISGGDANDELGLLVGPAGSDANDAAGSITIGHVIVDNEVEVKNAGGAALPVSGPLTNAELRAVAVPVSGTVEVANDVGNPLPVNGTVEVTNDVGNPLPVNGTVEVTNDVGNPLPVVEPGQAYTPAGVTVGAGSTAVLAANAARKYLLIQNQSAVDDVWLRTDGAAAVADKTAFKLGPGQVWEPKVPPTAAIKGIRTGGAVDLHVIEA